MTKRVFDIIFAIPILIAFFPIMLTIAFAIRIKMGKGVLFKQLRPGYRGQPFVNYKFRTMRHAYDKDTQPLSDRHRLTLLGNWLRRSSLDELPELLNVIKGDMSMVGPRPLLMQYLDRYNPEQARRHNVKPGITGWAQVNGRNAISWEEKFELDTWYVDNHSLALDLNIILMTVKHVLRQDGITAQDESTMPEFFPEFKPSKPNPSDE